MSIRRALTPGVANAPAYLGLLFLALLLSVAIGGPLLLHASPYAMVGRRFDPPGGEFILGTDYLGRDVLVGIVTGARTSLLIAVSATMVILVIGLAIGAMAGYYGGKIDASLMRVTEFFQIMPGFLFAMVLVAIFSPRLWTIIFAIGLSNWASTARLVRAEFLTLKEREFVQASRALGTHDIRIIAREILPNAFPIVIANGSLTVGDAILFEAGLSFLGLSDPNVISWGYMIGTSRVYLREAWWTVTFPGLAIVVTVVAVALAADWLNEVLNPRLRSRRA